MVIICIKQYLSNIWSSIHEKFKQYWEWVEKSVAYEKKACILLKKLMISQQFFPQNFLWVSNAVTIVLTNSMSSLHSVLVIIFVMKPVNE